MKQCIACHIPFEASTWECPSCRWSPAIIDGYLAFSPELALQNDGLDGDSHHILNEYQEESFWFRGRNQLIKNMIQTHFKNAGDVLEIGCGSGYVLSGIRDVLPASRLTATDIYSNGLSYASQRVSEPRELMQVDARKLPFSNEFDLIGAFDVLEHIEEDCRVIENMYQALKPGGGLILTVPQHPWLWSKADDAACHKRRYCRQELAAKLQDKGFEVCVDTSFMFFLLPVMLLRHLRMLIKKDYKLASDLALPTVIDKTFAIFLGVERWAIKLGMRFPVGGSRLVVARRK